MSFKEEFLRRVKEAMGIIKDVDEPYRAIAFEIYLKASLSSKLHASTQTPQSSAERVRVVEGNHEFQLPEDGKAGILQFGGTSLKFPATAFDVLNIAQAIGLLLYELDRPLRPVVIAELLTKGWKKVARKTVNSQLTGRGKQFVLTRYVIKEGDGYRLTGEGLRWVEREVISKLKTNQT